MQKNCKILQIIANNFQKLLFKTCAICFTVSRLTKTKNYQNLTIESGSKQKFSLL